MLLFTIFTAGILSFFAPCIVPLIPVYIGILSTSSDESKKLFGLDFNPKAMLRTLLFVLGLSTSFAIMGFGAGLVGSFLRNPWFFRILGLIVIVLGLWQMGLFSIDLLERTKKLDLKRSRKGDGLGAYLLGFTFSFGWTPCVGSVLGMILSIGAKEGEALTAMGYMLIYGLGLSVPFLIMTLFSTAVLKRVKHIEKALPVITVIGGILIVIMGVLLMFDKLSLLTWRTL
ncbi:cytochrome c biogenesis CcdA family protein [Guggenheimella bovis]